MTGLLDLSDDELAALPIAEVERLDAAARRAFATARRWTHRQWDHAVETWNDLPAEERRARHACCVPPGRPVRHRWVALPMAGCFCCARCLLYKVVDPE